MTSDIQITRPCPSCGRELVFSPGDLPILAGIEHAGSVALGAGSDPPGLDRVLHALCGCYVFEMPEASLGRLLASVLAVEGDDPGERGDQEPSPR